MFQMGQRQAVEARIRERSIEEIAGLFDESGTSLPRHIQRDSQPKSMKDVDASLYNDFGTFGAKYHNNLPLAILSTGGLMEYTGQKVSHMLSHVEGGMETLQGLTYPFVFATDKVKEISQEFARSVLSKEQYKRLETWYSTLPYGAKVMASNTGDGLILYGVGKALGFAIKPSQLKVKSELYKTINLEPKPALTKFEHHLALSEGSVELIGGKSDFSSHFTARDKIIENPYLAKNYLREVENITNLSLGEQQITLLKKAMQSQEFSKLDILEKGVHRSKFESMKPKLRVEWEQNTGQKWPVYEIDVLNSSQTKTLRYKGDLYDAHHIVQIDHTGHC